MNKASFVERAHRSRSGRLHLYSPISPLCDSVSAARQVLRSLFRRTAWIRHEHARRTHIYHAIPSSARICIARHKFPSWFRVGVGLEWIGLKWTGLGWIGPLVSIQPKKIPWEPKHAAFVTLQLAPTYLPRPACCVPYRLV